LASSSTSQIKVWRTDTAEGSHFVRIDNNKLNGKLYLDCWCYGVVDHNEWATDSPIDGLGHSTSLYSAIFVFENSFDRIAGTPGDGGYGSYKRDLTVGLAGGGAAWHIEDNY